MRVRELLLKVDRRFIRFLFVGVLNTLFGYGVFSLFIFLHLHYALASLLSTLLGIAFNFKTIGKLVFGNGTNRLFVRFILVYALIYFLNIGFLKLLAYTGINLYVAAALLLLPMAMVSFVLNKRFVFGRSYETEN